MLIFFFFFFFFFFSNFCLQINMTMTQDNSCSNEVLALIVVDSTNELPHEKTNNVIFEQILHKPSCTSTEDC